MAAHWNGAPCSAWQVRQWQYFVASGRAREMWYTTRAQWQVPVQRREKDAEGGA
jgi:hypothetical protein